MSPPPSLLQHLHLAMLAAEVRASAAIEGVELPREAVLAAVAQRLGLSMPTPPPAGRAGARKVRLRQHQVIELMRKDKAEWIDVRRYMAATGMSKATATRDLTELVDRGHLQRDGTGKASRYFLVRIG